MTAAEADCPFCRLVASGSVARSTTHSAAFADKYPVTDGHMLIVPRRHVASIFELTDAEYEDLWALVRAVRAVQDRHCNVGVNDGADAGQTVFHGHVHVIPRSGGDSRHDPRGGVRRLIPHRAEYWENE